MPVPTSMTLPFEYSVRFPKIDWTQFEDGMTPAVRSEWDKAMQLVDRHDRELEDYLKGLRFIGGEVFSLGGEIYITQSQRIYLPKTQTFTSGVASIDTAGGLWGDGSPKDGHTEVSVFVAGDVVIQFDIATFDHVAQATQPFTPFTVNAIGSAPTGIEDDDYLLVRTTNVGKGARLLSVQLFP